MASLWADDGRSGRAVRLLQIVLWRRQSVFWQPGEQYEMERHDEQNLESAALQIAQVGVSIWW